MKTYITCESVFKGHPDKVCDQVSDAILDACLAQDRGSRVAVECLIKDDMLVVAGEVTTSAKVDYAEVAKATLREIGYTEDYRVVEKISRQSPDIAIGVDKDGAGDQGIVYGYATNETPEYMPLAFVLSRRIAKRMDAVSDEHPDVFGKDGKCQVTVAYKDRKPKYIKEIIVSTQTRPGVTDFRGTVVRECLARCLPADLVIPIRTRTEINPTGEFVVGGPFGDCGLTGRKIIADTYGGVAHHGGGAFSGKDPTKVDRSGAYMARYIAKNIVAAGLADECEVSISYCIGRAKPVEIHCETFGTNKVPEELIGRALSIFDCTPKGIISRFGLRDIKYRKLAEFGAFGLTDVDEPYEATDSAERLKRKIDAQQMRRD